MTLPHSYRMKPPQDMPERPSHFEEGPEERTEPTVEDYATEGKPVDGYGLPAPLDPFPVYMTEPPPKDRTMREWSPGGQFTLDSTPVQLAGADRRRTRLIIRNLSTDKLVYVTRRREDTLFMGDAIPFGQFGEYFHNSTVWVRCNGADTANICYFTEYEMADS